MLGVLLLPAYTCLGHECQDLLSPCDGMYRLDLGLYSTPKEFGGNEASSKGGYPASEDDRMTIKQIIKMLGPTDTKPF